MIGRFWRVSPPLAALLGLAVGQGQRVGLAPCQRRRSLATTALLIRGRTTSHWPGPRSKNEAGAEARPPDAPQPANCTDHAPRLWKVSTVTRASSGLPRASATPQTVQRRSIRLNPSASA